MQNTGCKNSEKLAGLRLLTQVRIKHVGLSVQICYEFTFYIYNMSLFNVKVNACYQDISIICFSSVQHSPSLLSWSFKLDLDSWQIGVVYSYCRLFFNHAFCIQEASIAYKCVLYSSYSFFSNYLSWTWM